MALAYLEPFVASREPDATERPGILRVHQWVLRRQGYWRDELLRLRSILRSEIGAKPPAQIPEGIQE